MKKRYSKLGAEYAAAILIFCVLTALIQKTMEPVYMGDTNTVDGFYELERDSVEVLFLGPSQMYCCVNAMEMTDSYGINTYDFGASWQNLTMTKYFLEEALKEQKPQVVAVEISSFYKENADTKESAYARTYDAMPLSWNKLKSIYEVSGSNYDVLQYGLLPILEWHSRWAAVDIEAVKYNWGFSTLITAGRGYLKRDTVEKEQIEYLSDEEGDPVETPQETAEALDEIARICEQNDIELFFFKAPVASWSRAESKNAKTFMTGRGYTFLEMNDYLDEIGIDADEDFYNESHLNSAGAEKTTAFLVDYLKENYDL